MPVKLANNFLVSRHAEARADINHLGQNESLRYLSSPRDLIKVQNHEVDLSLGTRRRIPGGNDSEQPLSSKSDIE